MLITEELLIDINELIKDQKFEVRKGVLGLLLQCANVEQNRRMLESTQIVKYFLRYMKEEVSNLFIYIYKFTYAYYIKINTPTICTYINLYIYIPITVFT